MIMNEEKLFEAIGTIDDSLIRRSEQTVRSYKFVKWGSVAAVLVLVASMGTWYIHNNMGATSSSSTYDTAAVITSEFDNGSEKSDTAAKKESAEVEAEDKIGDLAEGKFSSQSQMSGSTSSSSCSDMAEGSADYSGDIPVDESNYNESREYSEELTDLQNRISTAMGNGELPFVVSSAIYENPDRLHVEVTTDDEDFINKLKAYDTTGELLEIEYRLNGVSDYIK
jgi:flagellum-specific peptidoglycan hydrolase FlgJ